MSDALKRAQEALAASQSTLGNIDARDEATKRIAEEKPDSIVQQVKDIALTTRRIGKVMDAAMDFYGKVSAYTGPLLKPLGWAARGLRDAFYYASYERENGDWKLDAQGDAIFSPKRLAKSFALATMIGVAGMAGTQAAYFHGTQFSELVYVTGKEQIVPGELYQLTGCTSLPCSTASDNGKYYQIEQSMMFPRLIYPEEDVFANIPAQNAACEIDGYGIYFKSLKPVFKWAEWYQNVYNVSCRPLTEAEISASISSGAVAQPHLGME